MSDQSTTIISKVWSMCNPLRDDGVSYGDYLEQLTYLIFLKMSHVVFVSVVNFQMIKMSVR